MSIEKEIVIKSIQEMPDMISFDQLLEKLRLLFKLEEGLKDIKNGNYLSLEGDKKRHEKWQETSTPYKNKKGKKVPHFGSMKGLVVYMAPDFNEPLEDFKEYM